LVSAQNIGRRPLKVCELGGEYHSRFYPYYGVRSAERFTLINIEPRTLNPGEGLRETLAIEQYFLPLVKQPVAWVGACDTGGRTHKASRRTVARLRHEIDVLNNHGVPGLWRMRYGAPEQD
jgi:hypothetical protein